VSRAARRLVAALACLTIGCSPTYVLRAAYGEAKILWRRVPLQEVLAQNDLDPAVRRKILLVEEARRFATTIGLEVGGSFGSLSYVDTEDTVFVVSASKRTALEPYVWWFPIVGSLPYQGYFDRERADEEADRLEAEGYDTLVRPAAAFSTLGWFDDPLLRHLLDGDEVFLVDLVLHELYHQTFFLRGAKGSSFNESLATFVGNRGAIQFLKTRPDDQVLLERAETRWADELAFAAFLSGVVERLEEVYAGTDEAVVLAAREEVFARAQAEFKTLPLAAGRFASFAEGPLNNAVVLYYRLYTTDLRLFERVWEREGGLRPALDVIERLATSSPEDPFAAVRASLDADALRAQLSPRNRSMSSSTSMSRLASRTSSSRSTWAAGHSSR
jgi:predicted aminopeptidase